MDPEQYKALMARLDRIEKKVDGWLYTSLAAVVSSLAAIVTALLKP